MKKVIIVAKDFNCKESTAMICGSAEAESRAYKKITTKKGRIWLVAVQPNEADNIYVEAHASENGPGYKGSRGFGGRTLSFKLDTGETIELKGPWHSNAKALYEATGYDIRDKHRTFGVVAMRYESPYLRDVVYKDDGPTIGTYSRVDDIAQEIANHYKRRVYVYVRSEGGSHRGPVDPEGNTYVDDLKIAMGTYQYLII
jgi:hypothetical protein